MSLSARSIALGGLGFGARHTALLGLVPMQVNPPVVLPSYGAVPMVSGKVKAGKSQTKRNNEALLLMLLK
jgi:hypothetical protein